MISLVDLYQTLIEMKTSSSSSVSFKYLFFFFILCLILVNYVYASKNKATPPSSTKYSNNNNNNIKTLKTSNLKEDFNSLYSIVQYNDNDFISSNKKDNIGKNRYSDILAIEETRVKLSIDQDTKTDYINANYVLDKQFILTQGPLSHTIKDFWKMTWEQNSNVIVMLTNIIENGIKKCDQYWPNLNDSIKYGRFIIENIKEDNIDNIFIKREFKIINLNTNESKIIRQYHYIAWPDHGVPSSFSEFITFLDYIEKETLEGPIVVHCSAGIGRSGTFCVVKHIIDEILKKDLPFNSSFIKDLVTQMRRERIGSVQTLGQYEFCFNVLDEKIKSLKNNIKNDLNEQQQLVKEKEIEQQEEEENQSSFKTNTSLNGGSGNNNILTIFVIFVAIIVYLKYFR